MNCCVHIPSNFDFKGLYFHHFHKFDDRVFILMKHFDSYAIGGSLGKSSEELMKLLEWMMPMFEEGDRKEKPRHLLGIADENSILGAARFGLDTFDSCYPTRVARNGTLVARQGRINISSGKKYSKAYGVPVDEECGCTTCSHYDMSYLWHLYKALVHVYNFKH